jgi:hypothetical protein
MSNRATANGIHWITAIALAAALSCASRAADDSETGAGPVSSGGGGPVSLEDQLRQMQSELANLRHDNAAMKGEIDELRARTEDNWLTEERANEIRTIVEDVLADADTRSSLLNDGLAAGWSEHFFLASPDGRFMLMLEGLVQARFIFSGQNNHNYQYGFENSRTYLTFRGHVFTPDLTYLVRGNFNPEAQQISQQTTLPGGFMQLLDAWVRYNLDDSWSARVGQFKLPFNREELVYAANQQVVERSLVNQLMNLGRSQGFEVTFLKDQSRLSAMYSDGASPLAASGLIGGSGANTAALASPADYAVSMRYEHLLAGNWEQFRDFTSPQGEEPGTMAGVAVHYQKSEAQNTPFFAAAADLSWEFGGANAFVGATYWYIDNQVQGIFDFFGIVAQVGVYVAPKWEVYLRGEYLQGENRGAGANTIPLKDLGIFTLGANYYIEGHDVKWTADVGFAVTPVSPQFANQLAGWRPDTDTGEVVFRTQLQLLF